ncbi:MAG: isoleucine--tRNA ligase [Synergistaceae bacterium]|nr:isoleucine--tRNA ligase [Synergistaceae bacterium]
MSVQDYKATLNLPQTDFPMRANLSKREPEFLKFWEEIDAYHKMINARKGAEKDKKFILHDGPPYANGHLHIGTAFNKILKDFFPKYKSMTGWYAPYVPGWDTHGLPIELNFLKGEGQDKNKLNAVELREKCTAYAYKFLEIQREEFKRLGVLGEWSNPYVTLKPDYEATELLAFATMVDKGYVSRGLKSVHWCIDCQTALAAGEIEYWDEPSPSVYVAYPMPELSKKMDKNVHVVIWTTTPWTLPASLAVAIHQDYSYGFYEVEDKVCLIATELKDSIEQATKINFGEAIKVCKGSELEGEYAIHPYLDERKIPLLFADYILLDSGTGCVHTAPGHGVEDYETGIRYGLEIYNPVNESGIFVKDTPHVGGLDLENGGKKALSLIDERGRLLKQVKMTHSYPHCWRCKKPIIFRATEQWFISVSDFKARALECIDNEIKFIPAWGHDRIYNMVRDRLDWCISRQRIWGVPIPAMVCEDCGEFKLTGESVRAFAEKVRNSPDGCTLWWKNTPQELFGAIATCDKCGSKNMRKDNNIIDVWFDSGCSHFSVLESKEWPELEWPCTLYLEGADQHRGWFQSSLLISVAVRGRAPYNEILTHGFTMDGEGRKMSKSVGNVVAPQEVIDEFGADVMRLWVASTDYRNDVRCSKDILKSHSETYRRIRNTARFLLGNLKGFDPRVDMLQHDELLRMDKWILSQLNRITQKVTRAFEEAEFHIAANAIHQFCVNELSAFYLDVSKDRLYAEPTDSLPRRSAQSAMWVILSAITRMLAPILSFTCEEVWQEMRKIDVSLPETIFMSDWPEVEEKLINKELDDLWDKVMKLRGAQSRVLEQARAAGLIGQPLEACVQVQKCEELDEVMNAFTNEELEEIGIVSKFSWADGLSGGTVDNDTEYVVKVTKAADTMNKCPRCWRYFNSENKDSELCPRCTEVMKG